MFRRPRRYSKSSEKPFPAVEGLRSWKDGVWLVKLRKAEIVRIFKNRSFCSDWTWAEGGGWLKTEELTVRSQEKFTLQSQGK